MQFSTRITYQRYCSSLEHSHILNQPSSNALASHSEKVVTPSSKTRFDKGNQHDLRHRISLQSAQTQGGRCLRLRKSEEEVPKVYFRNFYFNYWAFIPDKPVLLPISPSSLEGQLVVCFYARGSCVALVFEDLVWFFGCCSETTSPHLEAARRPRLRSRIPRSSSLE